MAANPLAMDLGSTMDVDVGSLHVSVGNALNAMNNQMSMDVDLFGDPLDIQEMAHPTIASKQLQQRLDELRARGCCQYVPSPDPFSVKLTNNSMFKEELLGQGREPLPQSQKTVAPLISAFYGPTLRTAHGT